MDSGASERMVKDRELLNNLQKGPSKTVTLRDGSTNEAKWTGFIYATSNSNGKMTSKGIFLEDVLYLAQLECNLLSCSALDRKGFSCTFGQGYCSIAERGVLSFETTKKNGLYTISTDARRIHGMSAVSKTTINPKAVEIWDNRFGHRKKDVIKKMASNFFLSGIELSIVL